MLVSFLPLAKRQTPQCVETQTTSSASTAVDSTTCNSSSLLGSEASADEPDTNVDVVEDQDCHFKSKAGEMSEPNDCLAAARECQPRSACSSSDTLSYDIG